MRFAWKMVRPGPSATNKQPWRVVKSGDIFHFFEYKTPGYTDRFTYDIQRLDMGIAACHFDLATQEKGLPGKIDVLSAPNINMPENVFYSFSWVY